MLCAVSEFAAITTLGLKCAGRGCSNDGHCSAPNPVCNTTINRCVPCTTDSDCPGSENYCHTTINKCETCVWDADYACNTLQTKRVKHCRLSDGTIKKTQELSCALSKICKNNQCVTPANCTAANQQWTQGSHSCQGAVTAANHKATQTLTDNTGTSTGIAVYRCWDGSWQKQSGVCGTACIAATQTWSQVWGQNTKTCTGSITAAVHGQVVTATDSTGTEQGTATYQCGGGLWTKTASTCEPYCSSDTDCASPKAACKTSTNRCVECTSNSHCSAPTPNCNTTTNTCQACYTCAAGCTAWTPSTSNTCDDQTVSQTRSCTNTCGSYNCATSRTAYGSQDCQSGSGCSSNSDCGWNSHTLYENKCHYGSCVVCEWEYYPQYTACWDSIDCLYAGIVLDTYSGWCGWGQYCDGTCQDCNCTYGLCVNNRQTYSCSDSNSECPSSGTIDCH